MRRQATGRATLAPVARTKGGKTFWCARGSIPVRKANDAVGSRRVERGFGADCTTEKQRQAKCAEWNREYEERFRSPKRLITFARAYTNYLGKQHALPMYGEEILSLLGTTQCSDIDDTVMDQVAEELWPDGAAPATINRHLYTPVIAILHQALKQRAPELMRPKGHRAITPVVIPPEGWYRQVMPHLSPTQVAFVMFLAMHGRRTREALGRTAADLDVAAGILNLGKTKTGVRQVYLHPNALGLITDIPGWQTRKWLFGCGPNSANSFRRDLKTAILKSGASWFTPHSFGRHTSVTRMLRAGYSVAHVADAHGMTPEMVTRRYGHLTKKETTAAMHAVGGDLYNDVINGGKLGDGPTVETVEMTNNPLRMLEILPARSDDELSPSEGDALSNCATGAAENTRNSETSTEVATLAQARTGQKQTRRRGGNAGLRVGRSRHSRGTGNHP